jgi:hypothetical protein
MAHKEGNPEYRNYLDAFRQGLLKLGWIEGRNVRIDARWGALDDPDQRQHSAKELLALQPDTSLRRTRHQPSRCCNKHHCPDYFCGCCRPSREWLCWQSGATCSLPSASRLPEATFQSGLFR